MAEDFRGVKGGGDGGDELAADALALAVGADGELVDGDDAGFFAFDAASGKDGIAVNVASDSRVEISNVMSPTARHSTAGPGEAGANTPGHRPGP